MKTIESSRLDLQAHLDDLKSQKQRNIMGQFATPGQLAIDILSHAKRLMSPNTPVRFLDPAIGTGSFYSALLDQFPSSQILSAKGFEIDPHYGRPAIDLWKSSPLEIQIGDFTAMDIPIDSEKPNLIICNPPYVRHHHLSASMKIHLAEKAARHAGIEINGLAGLYCHFMAIAHAWMPHGGIAGWLIPSEFMDVNYGSAIRKYLTESVELLQIHRFDPSELQFGDAQVSSAVIWIRKQRPSSNHVATLSYGGTLSRPLISRQTPLSELRTSKKWSGLAHGPTVMSRERFKMSDLFRIKRGLATGNNKFFVLSEDKIAELKIPQQFLKPLLPSPRYLEDDIVVADSTGNPILSPRLYLLDCDVEELKLAELSPELAKYLESGRERAAETYICSRRSPWYSQEVRPPAPIVCTYMGRGLKGKKRPFRFILNKSGATALNVYLMLYPTPLLARAMARDPQLISKIWRFLNEVSPEALLGEGRVYGGGLYKMEPRELANLPADQIMALLPKLGSEQMTQNEMFVDLVA